MHPTKNDIPLAKRNKIVALLNELLASATDLGLQTKQAHWNVKGDNFIALHELFDTLYTEVTADVDLIAERIVQLGGTAEGTVQAITKGTHLKTYPLSIADSKQHVEALSSAIAAFNAPARKAIDESDELGDAITADMLTGIVRGLDKQLWFVESHLPTAKTDVKLVGKAQS